VHAEVVDASQRGSDGRRWRPGGSSLVLALLGLVVVVVLAGLVASTVFAILRVVELLVVAVATGLVGYRIGVARGRHELHEGRHGERSGTDHGGRRGRDG
jgi:hypothetical protein